jgi:hypothetical protein
VGVDVTECVFCGNKPVTAEHVWGDWLNKKYKNNNPKARVSHRVISNIPGTPISDSRGRLDNSGSSLSKKYKAVCAECNNTWMSRIESKFKLVFEKMQQDSEVLLDFSEVATVRNWCYLKLLIQESIWLSDSSLTGEGRTVHSYIFARLREEFAKTQIIPSDCNFFICRAQPATYGPGAFTYNTAILSDSINHVHAETFSATLPNFGFVTFKNIPNNNRCLNWLRLATLHGVRAATFRVLDEKNTPILFPYNQQALDVNLAEIAVSIMNDLGHPYFKMLGDF